MARRFSDSQRRNKLIKKYPDRHANIQSSRALGNRGKGRQGVAGTKEAKENDEEGRRSLWASRTGMPPCRSESNGFAMPREPGGCFLEAEKGRGTVSPVNRHSQQIVPVRGATARRAVQKPATFLSDVHKLTQ
jgi:hypothetical protein